MSCSFPSDSTAEECAIQLQNNEHTFSFNLSRQAHEELILLECFTVPETGVFSVLLYEVELGGAIGYHITCGLPDVIIKPGIIHFYSVSRVKRCPSGSAELLCRLLTQTYEGFS